MSTEIVTAGIEADIYEIQDKIIESGQRILPIMSHGNITGVITRTDLLNTLVRRTQKNSQTYPGSLERPIHARTRNIAKLISERLPEHLLQLLKKLGEAADKFSFGAYIVGGFVRDLLLYRNNEDIDVVIEGDGIAFAKKFAQEVGARIHSYEKFGTAVIIFPDNFKLDVASARLEYYRFPAAMPTVKMSSIKLDLFRRDFTINTLAIQLNTDKFGTLIDFFSAQKDLKEKVIRVLHNLSFVEDPTRVFRAIRFEQRFGFSIGKLTLGLIENAVKMEFFKRLSGRRVFTELKQILEEDNPVFALTRLDDFNLLQVIHPSIRLDDGMISKFKSAKKVISWHDLLFLDEVYSKWIVYLLVLLNNFERAVSEEICNRFELAQRYKKTICLDRFKAYQCMHDLENQRTIKNSTLYKLLSGFKIELILYMMAITRSQKIKKAISYYVTHLRDVKISLKGRDLQKLGLQPGPIYREIFIAVHDAKLNHLVKSRRDEIDFVKAYLSQSHEK
jgi:tRNA nucleotidyltransferase (CCA-adding enzyme)